MNLTKHYITENLLRTDGKLNNRRLNGLKPEDIYLVFHSIDKPTCKNCNETPSFKNFTKGYLDYCSYSCSSKHQKKSEKALAGKLAIDKDIIKAKTKKTCEERYGGIGNASKELLAKFKESCGTLDLDLDDFILYRNIVNKITKKQQICSLENRGKSGVEGAYQLDHKFSVSEGFKQNIPPYIIGGIKNLEFIPWWDNASKGNDCSISLDNI